MFFLERHDLPLDPECPRALFIAISDLAPECPMALSIAISDLGRRNLAAACGESLSCPLKVVHCFQSSLAIL